MRGLSSTGVQPLSTHYVTFSFGEDALMKVIRDAEKLDLQPSGVRGAMPGSTMGKGAAQGALGGSGVYTPASAPLPDTDRPPCS